MDDGDSLPLKHYPPESGYDSPAHSQLPPYVDPEDTPSVRQKPGMPWTSLSPAYNGMSLPLPSKPSKGNKRIDFVLVYNNKDLNEIYDPQQKKKLQRNARLRDLFIRELQRQGIETFEDVLGSKTYVKLHTSFSRLCQEAETVKLEMPLTGCEIYDDAWNNCCTRFFERTFETDNEVDFVSAPFDSSKLEVFEGYRNEDTFFRPSLRGVLTRHILINMDVHEPSQVVLPASEPDSNLQRRGLPYFLMKKIFLDGFTLHDEAANDLAELDEIEEVMALTGQKMSDKQKLERRETKISTDDTRQELNDTWCKPFKFQPLWKVRNYFGEKIGLYFAWSGSLITSLWIPALFGLAVFIYGLVLSLDKRRKEKLLETSNANTSVLDEAKQVLTSSLDSVKEAFDNDVTPYFALVICLWGTIFLEYWKRKNATLAYEWDVDGFESSEPDRPQFFGTKTKPDPVTMIETWYYPMKRQMIKFSTSAGVLFIMVCVVFISVAAVILYRVIMSIDFCREASEINCLLVSTICSSILNAISIMILGKLYEKLAMVLTDWENHRTQTQYDDALILKLFAFQFANSYSSLFYIAFFRGVLWPNGIFGLGEKYQDTCGSYNYTVSANGTVVAGIGSSDGGANCMSMLSFQLLTVMIIKPLPKFFKDIVIPWLRSKWKKRQFLRKKKIHDENERPRISTFVEREYNKPELSDFTLTEYTEKIIMYGYVMLFSASFSLGPLIVLIILLVDIRVDAKRMLWMYRRPIAYISQDIGMWFNILSFLNVCGVVSNAFIVAFTSRWGQQYSMVNRLWIVIGFENIVFLLKFLLAFLIPDVPNKIIVNKRQEKYQVAKILNGATRVAPRKSQMGELTEAVDDMDMLTSVPPPDENELEADLRKRKKKRNFLAKRRLVQNQGLQNVSSLPPIRSSLDEGEDENKMSHWSVARSAVALKPNRLPDPACMTQSMGYGASSSRYAPPLTHTERLYTLWLHPGTKDMVYGTNGDVHFENSKPPNIKKRSSESGSKNRRASPRSPRSPRSVTTEYRVSWPEQQKQAQESSNSSFV